MSYYEEDVYSDEETGVSKYYKGSSLYDKYYVSYTSGRFHGTNSDSDVYQFYKENRLITIVGKTEYADEIKKLISDLGL